MKRILMFLCLASVACVSFAGASLPHVFGHNMVLQRGQKVPVWGRAKAGESVTVSFAGQSVSATADADGKWKLFLEPLAASAKGSDFVVTSSAAGRTVLTNVVVGEVWFCSGQSNMEFPMGGLPWDATRRIKDSEREIASANYPLLRHFKTDHRTAKKPMDDVPAVWELTTPKSVARQSAVAYVFGETLLKELDVPVGLINCSWGGTRIEPWTPAAHPDDVWFLQNVTKWKRPQDVPTVLWNGMVAGLVPYAIKGAIWYQGCANRADGATYLGKTVTLVRGWRREWGQGDFPYFLVQLAPFKYDGMKKEVLPAIQMAQAKVPDHVPNSGYTVINDVGNVNDIHPTDKRTVGTRLADQVLDRVYGKKVRPWKTPVAVSAVAEGSSVRVTFENAEGLKTRDGLAPTEFELRAARGKWMPAAAKIEGASVILSSPEVIDPTEVRFAPYNGSTPNLVNGDGLPAGPFVLKSVADDLLSGFRQPPHAARPHTWWHWMQGNVTTNGITADLEAMARVGIGGAQIFDVGIAFPKGTLPFAGTAWFDLLDWANREAGRLGIDLCLSNCSGWSSSGGPWITPELSMKLVFATNVTVKGGAKLTGALPKPSGPKGFYEDIAVLAFPKPAKMVAWKDFDWQVFRRRSDNHGRIDPKPVTEKVAPPDTCVDPKTIVDITSRMAADGRLDWIAPASAAEWVVLRVGYGDSGRINKPATTFGVGLECDKFDPHAFDVHFDAYIGKAVARLGTNGAFKAVLLDSYEVGGQNWTRGFEKQFEARRGYPITSYLPVLAGYPVGDASATERFLEDFRLTCSDLFCENYAGRLAERCRENGLLFYCEPYGNAPCNDFEYAAKCDVPMGEFWRPRDPGKHPAEVARSRPRKYMETRWGNRLTGNGKFVASVAHVYDRPIVATEAFTAFPSAVSGRWQVHPFAIKAQGDRVLSDGVNRMIFHTFVHQPWPGPTFAPGFTLAAYGSHFDRTQTWWNHGMKEFVAYLTRAQFLLQAGKPASDLLVCTPGAAPEYGEDGPDAPAGYACDRCPPAAFERVKSRYPVAVPKGASVDKAIAKAKLAPDFTCDDPDVTWIHRRTADDEIYFVAVPNETAKTVRCSFRDGAGLTPELWDAVSGTIARTPFRKVGGRTEIALDCEPSHSVFVVFRKNPTAGVAMPRKMSESGSVPVSDSWQVSFREPFATNDLAAVAMTNLVDWTTLAQDDLRYFSGTATYRTRLNLSAGSIRGGDAFVLDLGNVKEIAEVSVNGKSYPALWKPPFRVDVTDAIKSFGTLELEIRVTNLWPNRLIGDARLPEDCKRDNGVESRGYPMVKAFPDWLKSGSPSPTGRHAFSACKLWKATDKPFESGLLGPVRVLKMKSE